MIRGRFLDIGFPVSVDYDGSIEDAVALGRYDRAYPRITTDEFPTERAGQGNVVIELVNFDDSVYEVRKGSRFYIGYAPVRTSHVHKEISKMHARPIELRELLALGTKYPDLQRRHSIIALGSIFIQWDNDPYVPCLSGDTSRRVLGIRRWLNFWRPIHSFAVVRK